MRWFYDTEFRESGPDWPIQLYSIAIVSEHGKQFYRETPDSTNTYGAKQWLVDNVFPEFQHFNKKCACYQKSGGDLACPLVSKQVYPLEMRDKPWREKLAWDIVNFIGKDRRPELVGFYSAYDYVVFSQIFGAMNDMPKKLPYFALDLKQYMYHKGVKGKSQLPKMEGAKHNALHDAIWCKAAWEYVESLDKVLI